MVDRIYDLAAFAVRETVASDRVIRLAVKTSCSHTAMKTSYLSGMPRETPPLEAIEAFLAVAEAGGIRSGATVLSLSASATSRRVAALESFLGTALFERIGQGLRLTSAGRRYFDAVAPAMQAIGRASVMVDTDATRIVIAASHSLASRWLMPRAAGLRSEIGLTLDVLPTRDADVLRSGEAQFGLWGALIADDLGFEQLVDVSARPVSAPVLFDGRPAPSNLDALTALPLLAPREPTGMWQRWLALAGAGSERVEIVEHATMGLAYEAAAAGLGVALAIPMLCEAQLANGTLVPCGPARPIGERYNLYRAKRRIGPTKAETKLLHWLRREAASSARAFATLD